MNMLVKAAETECRGPLSKSGIRQPPIRAFMDGHHHISAGMQVDPTGPGEAHLLAQDEL